jgi:hypothetical protein
MLENIDGNTVFVLSLASIVILSFGYLLWKNPLDQVDQFIRDLDATYPDKPKKRRKGDK